jgi:glutamine amidotransferase
MTKIAVVDYGMGNLRSVSKALEHVAPNAKVMVSCDPGVISSADRVVFPGVGAMPDCMKELAARGLTQAIMESARNKPFLGICLGMQALFDWSEEGDCRGLGILAGSVRRFPQDRMQDGGGRRLKVPHIGWSRVETAHPHPLWDGIQDGERFYFVHSFYCDPVDSALVAGVTAYPFPYASAVARGNLFAVQFHPEKSQAAGLRILSSFVRWDGAEMPSVVRSAA